MSAVVLEKSEVTVMISEYGSVIYPVKVVKGSHSEEPPLPLLDEMVELVDTLVDKMEPLNLVRNHRSAQPYSREDRERVMTVRVSIMQEAVRLVEDREDMHAALLALYGCAIFRFDLTSKHMTWLMPRLYLSTSELRHMNNRAARVRISRSRG